jgi:hypothetical protein
MTDKEMNFRRLEQEAEKWKTRAEAAEAALDGQPKEDVDTTELDQWKAKAEIAETAAHRGILLEAGFSPDSGEAKALLRDLASGDVEADPAAVVVHASEYGWSPNAIMFSAVEARQLASAGQLRQIQTASVSDEPPNIDDEVAEARKAGDHVEALRMQTRQAAERMLKG